jgi:chaperonin cofactor prefoldin
MTLEYRCSRCGALLETTNADAVSGGEMSRLRWHRLRQEAKLDSIKVQVAAARQYFDGHNELAAEVSDRMQLENLEFLLQEIKRLEDEAHYNRGVCELAMKQRDEAEAEIERLHAERNEFENRLSWLREDVRKLRAERDELLQIRAAPGTIDEGGVGQPGPEEKEILREAKKLFSMPIHYPELATLDACAVPTPEQIEQMETGFGAIYTPRTALELGMKTAIGNVKRAVAKAEGK